MEQGKKKVVICGAGVIGSSIAYQLCLRKDEIADWEISVIERCDVACGASGKAGGFLARDWCDRSAVGKLARKSFEMFPVLAETLPSAIDYRRVDTLSVVASESRRSRTGGKSKLAPGWLDGDSVSSVGSIGDTSTTAQVHPFKYTHAMMEAAKAKGINLRIGRVDGIIRDASDGETITGVLIDGDTIIPADIVVIAMGPWSGLASQWIATVPSVTGHKAHSIVLQPSGEEKTEITAHACFVEYTSASTHSSSSSPEIYPRPNGEVYICGGSDDSPLPADPSTIQPTQGACESLIKFAKNVSSVLGAAQLEKGQACFLPISPDGLPVIGKLPGVNGGYIATGHSCWGILNSPATGLVMAELLIDGKTSVDISTFDPARFVKKGKRK